MPLEIIWPDAPDPGQDEVDREVAEKLATLPRITTPQAARENRENGLSVFPVRGASPRAIDRFIPGNGNDMRLRVIEPAGPVRGVYLHLHGGGWVLGRPHHTDYLNERLADATGLVVVSPYYRLAPEDPFPAGPDDALTAARWVATHSEEEWGATALFIGGESAGAHLAAMALIRMRDEDGMTPFRAANLIYGVYDLSLTPSARGFGDPPVTFSQTTLEWMIGHFLGPIEPTQPAVSPLFNDLSGLCPALFTVGTRDPLLDDSLFMAARWSAAGNAAVLAVQPGGHHAFDYFDHAPGLAARERMYGYLKSFLA